MAVEFQASNILKSPGFSWSNLGVVTPQNLLSYISSSQTKEINLWSTKVFITSFFLILFLLFLLCLCSPVFRLGKYVPPYLG